MSEKLYIKNFACFDEVEIELRKVNIFIGPQATGKSVVAKLFYFFKSILSDLINPVYNELDTKQFLFENFNVHFPQDSMVGDFTIKYITDKLFIELTSSKKSGLEFIFSELVEEIISKYQDFAKEKLLMNNQNPYKIYEDKCIQYALDKYSKPFYWSFIPAGRSYFSNLQSSIFSIMKNGKIDPMLIDFGSFYENIKYTFSDFSDKYQDILRGKFIRKGDREFIQHKDDRLVELIYTSSGQQEVLPLLMSLNVFAKIDKKKNAVIYIEEPEAHLYPSTQKEIVEIITELYNLPNAVSQLVITTHSPYIITAFNNLIQANNTYEAQPDLKEEVTKVVPENLWIKYEDVAAYLFKDGKIKSIMDEEFKGILATEIDDVSEELAATFDKLLAIEYKEDVSE